MSRRRLTIAAALLVLLVAAWWWSREEPTAPTDASATIRVAREPWTAPDEELVPPGESVVSGPTPAAPTGTSDSLPVRCAVRAQVPIDGDASVMLQVPSVVGSLGFEFQDTSIEGGVLAFDPPEGALGRGMILLAGFPGAWFSWTQTETGMVCPPIEFGESAAVVGRVHPAPDEGELIRVRACERVVTVRRDGTFALGVRPGDCTVTAERVDGWYPVASPPRDVSVGAGEEVEVDLFLPEQPQAGIGVSVEVTDEGFVVQAVRRGSAGDLAGLRNGDLIVGVDGQDLVGLDAPDLLAAALGDVGTAFEVELMVDGERTPLTLTRVYVDDGQREGASGQRESDPDAWVE